MLNCPPTPSCKLAHSTSTVTRIISLDLDIHTYTVFNSLTHTSSSLTYVFCALPGALVLRRTAGLSSTVTSSAESRGQHEDILANVIIVMYSAVSVPLSPFTLSWLLFSAILPIRTFPKYQELLKFEVSQTVHGRLLSISSMQVNIIRFSSFSLEINHFPQLPRCANRK